MSGVSTLLIGKKTGGEYTEFKGNDKSFLIFGLFW